MYRLILLTLTFCALSFGAYASSYNRGNSTNVGVQAENSTTINTTTNNDMGASSAAGFGLTTSDGTCMGSSGVGGQGAAFGFSLGTTWRDEKCDARRDARMLWEMGQPLAAKMRLCMDDDFALAYEHGGNPCPKKLREEVKAKRYSEPDMAAE